MFSAKKKKFDIIYEQISNLEVEIKNFLSIKYLLLAYIYARERGSIASFNI